MSISNCDPRFYIRRGMLAGDTADFDHAIKIDPDNKAAPLFLSVEQFRQGDLDSATLNSEKALSLAPGNVTAKAIVALIKLRKGESGDIVSLVKALPAVTLAAQGLLLNEVERLIKTFDHDNQGAKEKEDIMGGPIGWLLDRVDDFAILLSSVFSSIFNIITNISDPAKRRANALLSKAYREDALHKNREAAAKLSTEALTIDPDCEEAASALIVFHLEKGDVTESERAIDRLIKILDALNVTPEEHPMLNRWHADLAWLKNDFNRAITLYKNETASDPLSYFPPYRLALANLYQGNEEASAKAFTETLSRINPNLLIERVEFLQA